MRTTKKRMHGRRRRRSPLHSGWVERVFGSIGADGKYANGRNKDEDKSPEGAVNKNATTAASEASEKAAQTQDTSETAKVGTESTGSHDTTHSHPPTAIEGKKEAEEEGISPRERARNQAQVAVEKRGGSWGNRTFGW